MTKLLLDQGIPYSTGLRLQEAGWEAVHVSDLDMSRATDIEILTYARENDYVCVTLDADFHALLAVHNANNPSVIRIRREGLNGPALAELLKHIWPKMSSSIDRRAMITITEQTLRVHDLPIIKDQ